MDRLERLQQQRPNKRRAAVLQIGRPGPSPRVRCAASGGPVRLAPCAPRPGLCAGLRRYARPCPPPSALRGCSRPVARSPPCGLRGLRPAPPGVAGCRASPACRSPSRLRWPRPVGAGPRPSSGGLPSPRWASFAAPRAASRRGGGRPGLSRASGAARPPAGPPFPARPLRGRCGLRPCPSSSARGARGRLRRLLPPRCGALEAAEPPCILLRVALRDTPVKAAPRRLRRWPYGQP